METAQDLEDDELEHGAREGEHKSEQQVNNPIMHLVVSEQLFHKEQPAAREEQQLK